MNSLVQPDTTQQAAVRAPTTSLRPDEIMIRSVGRIHSALRRSLDTIVRVSGAAVAEEDRAGLAEFCTRFTRFLHVHHDAEEQILFPKFVEAAIRGSHPAFASDVSGFRHDHEHLLGSLTAFEAATAAFRAGGSPAKLHETACTVRDILFPHLRAEESVLDEQGLAKLLRADEVDALEAESATHGQREGGTAVLVFVAHALTADEQKTQFGAMPWIVRKVLFKIWARSFRGCLKFAHNPSFAI
jgi:iron-sulfur cluster repair protein YtfE (RIC family)